MVPTTDATWMTPYGILLRLIATTTRGPVLVAALRSPATTMTLMPAIDVGAVFIGREDQEGKDGSDIAT